MSIVSPPCRHLEGLTHCFCPSSFVRFSCLLSTRVVDIVLSNWCVLMYFAHHYFAHYVLAAEYFKYALCCAFSVYFYIFLSMSYDFFRSELTVKRLIYHMLFFFTHWQFILFPCNEAFQILWIDNKLCVWECPSCVKSLGLQQSLLLSKHVVTVEENTHKAASMCLFFP